MGRRVGRAGAMIVMASLVGACGDDPSSPPPMLSGTGGGGGGGGQGGAPEVTLQGAVQKGPLIIGSTLEVAPLRPSGEPLGEFFSTTITDDLGSFELTFNHGGPVSLIGTGFHYDEVSGRVSTAPITLRALAGVPGTTLPGTYVNVITHLAERRALALLESMPLAQAVAQAEQEVVAALAVGPSSFSPGTSAIQLNLLGGDTPANAYLFAVSASLVQAAVLEAGDEGSVDGELQELLNALAIDLEDGALDAPRADLVQQGETALLTHRALDRLAARLTELGTPATPPELNAVIDTDQDDVANAADSCAWVANPAQDPVLDAVCTAFDRPVAAGFAPGEQTAQVVDLDDDGVLDLAFLDANQQLTFLQGNGSGALTVAHQQPFSSNYLQLADVDDDDVPDVITLAQNGDLLVHRRGTTGSNDLPPPVSSAIEGLFPIGFAIGPVDGDAFPELLLVEALNTTSGGVPLPLKLLLNDGVGGFTLGAATADVPAGLSLNVRAQTLADVDADQDLDVVVAGFSSDVLQARVLVYPGDGTGELGAAIVSSGSLGAGDAMNPGALRLANLTADARPDLVVVRGSTVHVMAAASDGTYGAVGSSTIGFDTSFGRIVAIADFTGDSLGDLAVVDGAGTLAIVPNQGGGAFGTATTRVGRIVGDGVPLAAGDLDGNDAHDLVFGTGDELRRLMFVP